ncbi:MAG: hypothetical protein SFU86_07040 [Pirellulaceae bacterium]|nr:hypothetical protein [Pirellulaceae bacterium]
MIHRLLLSTLLVTAFATLAPAQEWGDLEATFKLKGDFEPKKITPDKDVAVCTKVKLVEQNWVVDPATKGIANIAVYFLLTPTGKKPPVHPDYAKTAQDKIVLDNLNCKYIPHVLNLRTSQTLVLKNSDPVGHNMKADFFANVPFNDLIPAGGQIEKKLPSPEAAFVPVSCAIHGWMNSYLLVRDEPYVGISDEKGQMVIKNLPVGEWTFVVWQEKAGYIGDVTLDGKPTTWAVNERKGRVKMTIKPGKNYLGVAAPTPATKGIVEITPATLKIQ